MTRDEALAKLRPMEADLRARGIEALYLFGSVARNEALAASDIDLAFDAVPPPQFGLFDQFEIRENLEAHFGGKVDFIERSTFRPRVLARIGPDIVRVF